MEVFYPSKETHRKQLEEYINLETTPLMRKDDWIMLYEFFNEISESLDNYELDTVWPSYYDSYVEWFREKK